MWPYITAALAAGLVTYKFFKNRANLNIYNGQSVWITGASSGIGRALAIEFYKAGAHVILSGRHQDTLEKVVNEDLLPLCKNSDFGPITPSIVVMDISKTLDPCYLSQIISQVQSVVTNNSISCIVHNAGLSVRALATMTSMDTDKYVFDVNTFGPIAITKSLLNNNMIPRDGRIIVVSSIQGLIPLPLRAAYSASKHATQAYFTSLRTELDLPNHTTNTLNNTPTNSLPPNNISVTIVSPGYVATNLSLNALNSSGGQHGKMDLNTSKGMDPQVVSSRILAAAARRENDVWLCPTVHKFAVVLQHIFPSAVSSFMIKKAIKEYQQGDF